MPVFAVSPKNIEKDCKEKKRRLRAFKWHIYFSACHFKIFRAPKTFLYASSKFSGHQIHFFMPLQNFKDSKTNKVTYLVLNFTPIFKSHQFPKKSSDKIIVFFKGK